MNIRAANTCKTLRQQNGPKGTTKYECLKVFNNNNKKKNLQKTSNHKEALRSYKRGQIPLTDQVTE